MCLPSGIMEKSVHGSHEFYYQISVGTLFYTFTAYHGSNINNISARNDHTTTTHTVAAGVEWVQDSRLMSMLMT